MDKTLVFVITCCYYVWGIESGGAASAMIGLRNAVSVLDNKRPG